MAINLEELTKSKEPYTALLYCAPGVGKSTAIGLIAEHSEGKTLVLDVDRTIVKTLAKHEVVKDLSRIDVERIDNIHTWDDWSKKLAELGKLKEAGKL